MSVFANMSNRRRRCERETALRLRKVVCVKRDFHCLRCDACAPEMAFQKPPRGNDREVPGVALHRQPRFNVLTVSRPLTPRRPHSHPGPVPGSRFPPVILSERV
jgi:hypothetical protein